jgi:hypothetical protein
MKNLIWKLVIAVTLGTGAAAQAAIDFTGGSGTYNASWSGTQAITDGGSGVGYALNFNDLSVAQITAITFTFTTTGGWNGDLYVYLSHGSGLAILLNKVGADSGDADGFGTSGFNNITLGMGSANDIHGVSSPTTGGGPYSADGRLNYTDTVRNNTLDVFNNADPNGSWTLFFNDVTALNQSTLTAWSVDITAVPEPVNVALGLFGVCLVAGAGLRQYRRSRRAQA